VNQHPRAHHAGCMDGWSVDRKHICVVFTNHSHASTYLVAIKCLMYLPNYTIITYISYLLRYDIARLYIGSGKGNEEVLGL